MNDTIIQAAALIVPMVLAIVFHEVAHGLAARALGDPTAHEMKRLSLNPLRHVDPIGTVVLPGLLALAKLPVFGWAKPVPVNFSALRHPKRDMIWVAAAGPAMNILLALLSVIGLAVLLFVGKGAPEWLPALLWSSVQINLVLAVLNLWPIPPLDGSKIAVGLLPPALALPLWRASRYGMVFLVAIFIAAPLLGIDVFGWMIGRPVAFIERGILGLLKAGAA